MRLPASRRNVGRGGNLRVIASAAVIAVRNATVYPRSLGYDAAEAIEYAQGLVERRPASRCTGSYYTPPGVLRGRRAWRSSSARPSGSTIRSGSGRSSTPRGGRHAAPPARPRAPALARAESAPPRGDRLLRRLPGRHEVRRDVPPRAAVDAAVDRRARARGADPRPLRLPAARCSSGSGSTLGLAQLVRAWTLWTLGVVVVVLLVAAVTRPRERRRLAGAIAIVAAVAILVPALWYAHQLGNTTAPSSGSRTPPSRSGRAGRSGSSSARACRSSSRRRTGRRSRVSSSPSPTPRPGATTSASGGGSRTRRRPRPAPAASS